MYYRIFVYKNVYYDILFSFILICKVSSFLKPFWRSIATNITTQKLYLFYYKPCFHDIIFYILLV